MFFVQGVMSPPLSTAAAIATPVATDPRPSRRRRTPSQTASRAGEVPKS
jgi:hypothetical protein